MNIIEEISRDYPIINKQFKLVDLILLIKNSFGFYTAICSGEYKHKLKDLEYKSYTDFYLPYPRSEYEKLNDEQKREYQKIKNIEH